MKFYAVFFLSIVVGILLAACGGAAATPTPTASLPSAAPTPPATPTPTASPLPTGTTTLPVSKVQEIRARGRLIVAVRREQSPTGIHFDPAHFQTRDLEVVLAKAIAKKLLGDENKVEFISGAAKDVVGTVEQGQADLGLATITHFPITDTLKQQVEVSEPFATGGIAIIVRTGGTIGTMKDLNGKRVAYIAVGRDTLLPEFDPLAKQKGLSVTIEQFASYDEAAAAMEAGQVQAMLGHTIAQTVYMAQNVGRLAFLGKPFTSEQFAAVAKKGDSELIAIVSEVLEELKASGELRRLAEEAGFPVESLALP